MTSNLDTTNPATTGAERVRLAEDSRREKNWKRWGPYLAERQWGTVREDYSADGDVWRYFPHEHARSRAYRWGEDGLLGITDRQCRLCFAVALWNGRDRILKERLFGLTGPEGNHGEDVKECYYYLDSTPTHSYMRGLYKYPQSEYPYERLVEENGARGRHDPELELVDTGVFNGNRYFDVFAEYAKASPDDVLARITVANRGPDTATIHVLPTLWFRNTWTWGCRHEGCEVKPSIERIDAANVRTDHASLGEFRFAFDAGPDGRHPDLLFTDNETNAGRLFGESGPSARTRDAFHDFVVHGSDEAADSDGPGTKVAGHYVLRVPAGGSVAIRLRLAPVDQASERPFDDFDETFALRRAEADGFFDSIHPPSLTDEERAVARQGYAGLLWSKQFYHYIVPDWLDGDPNMPPPPAARKKGRNRDWIHLYNRDVISMPDTWEYPWYAAWDLAFHTIPFARIDPHFAKKQLALFLREWYMHPNGQIPAYEFALSDVNPPVHAWAAWRVYKMTGADGNRDREFLASVFQKLLLNFTWWVNRKDLQGNHIFAGGFLGLDNIGVFDRSRSLPGGGHLEQADGTAWMAFYCNTMLAMALELAKSDPAAEDMASKFLEHFVAIADAMNSLDGTGLWDETDGFYYDRLHAGEFSGPLRVRSLVGVIPLIAVEVLENDWIASLRGFRKRLDWFLRYRRDLARQIAYLEENPGGTKRLLAIPSRERLERVLHYLLDEREFLSPYGLRSMSRHHAENPYTLRLAGRSYSVGYVPGESDSGLFGGNSNWRGPVWLPLNFLIVEALERYHHFYGDDLRVECPTGSGRRMNLLEVAKEISSRLARLFLPDASGRRPSHGDDGRYATDPHWKDLVLFHEYFHGDDGRGLGASHQTGWTALAVRLIEKLAHTR